MRIKRGSHVPQCRIFLDCPLCQKYHYTTHTRCTYNLKDCYLKPWVTKMFSWKGLSLLLRIFFSPSLKRKEVSYKFNWKKWSKEVKLPLGYFVSLQILPLLLNNHLSTVLLWHTNMWLFRSRCLIFNHPPMPLHIWNPLLPNKLVKFIICLNIRISL